MSSRSPVMQALPQTVVATLVGGQSCVLATLDQDGRPSTSLMTWLVASDQHRLALCVDKRSRSYENLRQRSAVAIEILADNVVCGVKGAARLVLDEMKSPPFPCALFIVDVAEVRDHGHEGTTFHGPRYVFADHKQHRAAFEARVYEELRTAE